MPILAQVSPTYQPAMRPINNINTGSTTSVVTTIPHQYEVGMLVRLNLPIDYSLQALNQKVGTITRIIDATTFETDINSYQFGLFTAPTYFPENRQIAQVTPVGEVNEQLRNATRNVLPY